MNAATVVNIALVVVFVLIGGVFAATEIALVSLRDSQISRLSRRGRRGARTAALARDPNRFLSAVQIGVTVAGFFSAAYGASTIAPDLAPGLEAVGVPDHLSDGLALFGTTLVIAYLSLVLGELVPKRIALQRSTGVALVAGPPLDRFAALMRPVIWLLSISTDLLVRLLGGDPTRKGEDVSPDELRELLVAHDRIPVEQRHVLSELFDAGQRSLTEVMRPRTEVDNLDAAARVRDELPRAIELGHSRFPVVAGGSLDDVLGFVHLRDLLRAAPDAVVGDLCRPLAQFPGSKAALAALAEMRRDSTQLVLVIDEYGGAAGIATLEDLVEEVVGEIDDEFDQVPQHGRLVDGRLLVDDAEKETGVRIPHGPYDTVAGFVLHRLQRLARPGDEVPIGDHVLTVTELAGHRIAWLRITRTEETAATDSAEPGQ
ncbi:hemolysin family protein [Rhodococcus gannanensis]|uniref:Hemolysin family protein n=1 Tax=Rhodococcus gannanensis TaxID=1960308 RepID=A0ABW4P771_9NOCA